MRIEYNSQSVDKITRLFKTNKSPKTYSIYQHPIIIIIFIKILKKKKKDCYVLFISVGNTDDSAHEVDFNL